MSKFFFKDPISATWMAAQFGFCFEESVIKIDTFNGYAEVCGDYINQPWRSSNTISAWPNSNDGFFRITKESEKILEPRAGDLVRLDKRLTVPRLEEQGIRFVSPSTPHAEFYFIEKESQLFVTQWVVEIIQRGGIPFIMPEKDQ